MDIPINIRVQFDENSATYQLEKPSTVFLSMEQRDDDLLAKWRAILSRPIEAPTSVSFSTGRPRETLRLKELIAAVLLGVPSDKIGLFTNIRFRDPKGVPIEYIGTEHLRSVMDEPRDTPYPEQPETEARPAYFKDRKFDTTLEEPLFGVVERPLLDNDPELSLLWGDWFYTKVKVDRAFPDAVPGIYHRFPESEEIEPQEAVALDILAAQQRVVLQTQLAHHRKLMEKVRAATSILETRSALAECKSHYQILTKAERAILDPEFNQMMGELSVSPVTGPRNQ